MQAIQKAPAAVSILAKSFAIDPSIFNVPRNVLAKIPCALHRQQNHPIHLIATRIQQFFPSFKHHVDLHPVVHVKQNFDDLLVPKEHPGRLPTDTYYINQEQLLRTHTSAHQIECLKQLNETVSGFTVTADVYRKDHVDKTHYPVFHQMEGVQVFPLPIHSIPFPQQVNDQTPNNLPQPAHPKETSERLLTDLKQQLGRLAVHLFGKVEMRWVDAYFPFTHPSYELEIYFQGQWLEVLGCGVIRQEIMANAGMSDKVGWAFGLGLERLAMVLFAVPDIRLFWSSDERFLSQFVKNGLATRFKPYSNYPAISRDVSFFSRSDNTFSETALMDIVRLVGKDLIEDVSKFDEFFHPKMKCQSYGYRIIYRSMDQNLTDEQVNAIQEEINSELVKSLHVQLR